MTVLHSPATAEDLPSMLRRQQAAFLQDGPPTARERRDSLRRLQETLLLRQPEITSALAQDFGHRAPQESLLSDIYTTVAATSHLSRHLGSWMKPERRAVALHFQPGRAWVESQPRGVVGVIAPWNYPLSLALIPLATALAAGNRVMLKPSEYTPATSALMAGVLSELFPAEQVAVVTGGPDIGAAFARLPFDLLCFTGSTSVGRAVMRAASEHLVPVILELGGKSPALIDSGYPLERAARSVAHGKLVNAGQTCIAPDYALLPAGQAEQFAQRYADQVRSLYPRWAENPDYCAIISQRHYDRLAALVEDARIRGATVIEIDAAGASRAAGRKFPPTVLLGVTDEMLVMREEIFGPILPVVTYGDLGEAIGYINAHPRPLALYYFGNDRSRQRTMLSGTTSGGVTINDVVLHYLQESLPFGGIGPSGMGRYHGVEGFRQFSHQKAVFRQARFNAVDFLRPPYGKTFERIMRVLMPS